MVLEDSTNGNERPLHRVWVGHPLGSGTQNRGQVQPVAVVHDAPVAAGGQAPNHARCGDFARAALMTRFAESVVGIPDELVSPEVVCEAE